MFSKTTSSNNAAGQPQRRPEPAAPAMQPVSQAAPAMQARPTPTRTASTLAADLVFEGTISGEGELLVDGAVKGDLHVSRLVIGEHAHVEGTIRGASIEVRGRVVGNIEGKQVRLLESAHVEGDIIHEQLSIDVGAFFQGRCSQFRPAAVATPVAQPFASAPAPTPVAIEAPYEAPELDIASH